jgi:2-(1,2-epoxy-1,2-dihydrophenyl)acetyl-CoA isomerase
MQPNSIDHQPLLTKVTNGVATVTLARPAVANALDLATARSLRDTFAQFADRADLRLIVLRGQGRLFCAGGDVEEMAAARDRPAFLADLAGTMHEALTTLRGLAVPVLAVVHGQAAGAGLGLVLAADIAIASDAARFVAAYSAIALSPDCGVTALLQAAVGARRAALLAITNITLNAFDAMEWGLVSEVCPADTLEDRVAELTHLIAERPGSSAGEAARLLRAASETTYEAQLADEAATIARLSGTSTAAALIATFTGGISS